MDLSDIRPRRRPARRARSTCNVLDPLPYSTTLATTISLSTAPPRHTPLTTWGTWARGRWYVCVCFKASRTYTPVLGALVSPLGTR